MGPGRIKVGRWRTGVWMVRRLGVVMVIIVVMVVKFSSCPVLGMSGSLLSGFLEELKGITQLNQHSRIFSCNYILPVVFGT